MSRAGTAEVLPGLALLPHDVRIAAPEASALLDAPSVDAVIVDARRDLVGARGLCRLLRTTGISVPLLAVLTEGGLVAVFADWGGGGGVRGKGGAGGGARALPGTAGPAEIDARLRMAAGRAQLDRTARDAAVRVGELTIDETTYSAKLRGEALGLTLKEFELLKFLAQHPGRVFTRAQLLQEVWGYDYYGGTRTVDVHVRRLRAKLGPEHEGLIGTVRHVGYKFVSAPLRAAAEVGEAMRVDLDTAAPSPTVERVLDMTTFEASLHP